MAYGSVLTDTVQSSTAGTPPQFNDGNGTQTGTLCRAWVNFNGTGTVAIRGSFNVSSITDNGTGSYTVNFTNAMPDANYAVAMNARIVGNAGYALPTPDATNTVSAFRLDTRPAPADANTDAAYVYVSVFR